MPEDALSTEKVLKKGDCERDSDTAHEMRDIGSGTEINEVPKKKGQGTRNKGIESQRRC
jgi:hypothetical protein